MNLAPSLGLLLSKRGLATLDAITHGNATKPLDQQIDLDGLGYPR